MKMPQRCVYKSKFWSRSTDGPYANFEQIITGPRYKLNVDVRALVAYA